MSDKYGRLCFKVANNILNNQSDAEECVNDAYLGVWNGIPPQKPNDLSAYVCSIVRNAATKKYHAIKAAKRNSFYDVALDELEDCLASNSTVEKELDATELSNKINAFLGSLYKNDRVMFVKRYFYSC